MNLPTVTDSDSEGRALADGKEEHWKRKQQAALSNLPAEVDALREQKKRKKADDHKLSNLPAEADALREQKKRKKAERDKLYRADVNDAGGRDALQKRRAQVKQEDLNPKP